MGTSLSARLLDALGDDSRHTAPVVRARYRPVGGEGTVVMPPTFPTGKNEKDLTKKYIVADRLDGARPGRTDSYVVTNQIEQRSGSQTWPGRTNGARGRAFVTPACDRFAVVWPDTDPGPDVPARLGGLARRVPYVGRSTSQAEVSMTGSPPEDEPAWSVLAPVALGTPGAIELRVPHAGYTDALRDACDRGGRAWEAAHALPYSQVTAVPAGEEPVPAHLSPWDDLIVWGFERPSARIGGDQVARLTPGLASPPGVPSGQPAEEARRARPGRLRPAGGGPGDRGFPAPSRPRSLRPRGGLRTSALSSWVDGAS